jgi:membrane associated rhomboid family serine protease
MIPIRDEQPIRSMPVITLALVAINILVFAHEMRLPPDRLESFINTYGAIPNEITHFTHSAGSHAVPSAATLVTSQFLHGGLLHLLGNMMFLWTFGWRVEDTFGKPRYLLFYLLCGIGAALTQVAMSPASTLPMIGASGAVAGILGAYFVRFPFHRVRILVPLIIIFPTAQVPAWIFLGLWFALQWYSAGTGEGIAWFAHIGGFLLGAVLAILWWKRTRGRKRRPAGPASRGG